MKYILQDSCKKYGNKKPSFIYLIYYQYDNTLSNASPLFLLTINKEVLTINENHFHLEVEYIFNSFVL